MYNNKCCPYLWQSFHIVCLHFTFSCNTSNVDRFCFILRFCCIFSAFSYILTGYLSAASILSKMQYFHPNFFRHMQLRFFFFIQTEGKFCWYDQKKAHSHHMVVNKKHVFKAKEKEMNKCEYATEPQFPSRIPFISFSFSHFIMQSNFYDIF